MIQWIKELKYKASTWTNLIFLVPAVIHAIVGNYFSAMAFVALAVSSYKFHYYTALYHEHLEGAKGWSKELYNKMKKWQYADVSSIYLIFGFYPYELSGNPWWLLYLIPMTFMIFNKFEILRPSWNPRTRIWIPLSAIPMVVLGFIFIPLWMMLVGIGCFAVAGLFSKTAEHLVDEEDYEGYDTKHGVWHKFAAAAFSFIF